MRHGTYAGYVAGCRQECCRAVARRYQKARVYDAHLGRPRMVNARGSRRRLQALHRMGYDWSHLAPLLGMDRRNLARFVSCVQQVSRTRAARIAAVYDELCMTPGPSQRARAWAERRNWAPPLAYDDIDNDPAPYMPTDQDTPDEVVIWRLMNGQPVTSTLTERREATRRLLDAGHTVTHIATCLHVSGSTARDLITAVAQEVAA